MTKQLLLTLMLLVPGLLPASMAQKNLGLLANALEKLSQELPKEEEQIRKKESETTEETKPLNKNDEKEANTLQSDISTLMVQNSDKFVQRFVNAKPLVQKEALKNSDDEQVATILQKTISKQPGAITKLIKNDTTGKINKPAPVTKLLVQLAVENNSATIDTVVDEIKPFFQKPVQKKELFHALIDEIERKKPQLNKKNQQILVSLFEKLIKESDPVVLDTIYQGKGKSVRERLEALKPTLTTTDTFIQDLISKLPPPENQPLKPPLNKQSQKTPLQTGFVKDQIKFYEDYYRKNIAQETAPSLGDAKQKLVFIKTLHEEVPDKIWSIKKNERTLAQEALTYLFKNRGTLPKNKPFVSNAIRLIARTDLDLVAPAIELNKEFYKGKQTTAQERGYDFMDEMFDWALNIITYYLEDIKSGALQSKTDERAEDLSRALRYLHQIWPYLEEAVIEAERGDDEAQKYIGKIRNKIELFRKLITANKPLFDKINLATDWITVSLDDIIREKNRVFCVSGWKIDYEMRSDNIDPFTGLKISGLSRTHQTIEARIPQLIVLHQTGTSEPEHPESKVAIVEDTITTGTLPQLITDAIDQVVKQGGHYYQSFRLDIDCALALIKALPQEQEVGTTIAMQHQIVNAINKFVGYTLDQTGLVCPACLTNNLQGRWIFGAKDALKQDDLNTIKRFLEDLDQADRFVKKALLGVEILRAIINYNFNTLSKTESGKQTLKNKYSELIDKLKIVYDEFGMTAAEVISNLDPTAQEWRNL